MFCETNSPWRLRRYDTIKTYWWYFFKFSWVAHCRKKMSKSGLKTGCHHAIFCVPEVKISEILQKLNIQDCFCLHCSFFMVFLAQKLIYTINIWFNFVLRLFFEKDRLLNLIILGVYAKRLPKCTRSRKQKLM